MKNKQEFKELERIAEGEATLASIEQPHIDDMRDHLLEYNQRIKEGLQSLDLYMGIIKGVNQISDESGLHFTVSDDLYPAENQKKAFSELMFINSDRWIANYEERDRFGEGDDRFNCQYEINFDFSDDGSKNYIVMITKRKSQPGLISLTDMEDPEDRAYMMNLGSMRHTDNPDDMALWMTGGLKKAINDGYKNEIMCLAEFPGVIKRMTDYLSQAPEELKSELDKKRQDYRELDNLKELEFYD
ncbi:MAG: hypothetical protein ACLFSL_04160 [Candidatus Woesearchaeota archaeon]